MKLWILYRDGLVAKSESYEVDRLVREAEERGWQAQVIAPEQFDLLVTRDDEKSIRLDGKTVTLPDVLLPRTGAGTTYFALSVIRQLQHLGVATFNTWDSIELVKDKLATHQVLAAAHLPIPKTMLAKFPVDVELVDKTLGFPLVVKTLAGSQGSGVFLCETKQKFSDLMELVRATQANANLIFQEFVADSRGRDLRILVIGGRVVAGMERRAEGDNFKANYSMGGRVVAFEPDRDAEWLALESARLLGLDIAGIDLLFDGEGYKICEANSATGFQGLEECTDGDIAAEILDFVSLRVTGRSPESRRHKALDSHSRPESA